MNRPAAYVAEFDYDGEPRWEGPTPPTAYSDDVQRFPRTPDHIPDWLRDRLAGAGDARRRGGFPRTARIFDGIDAAGRPTANRDVLDANELRLVLGYLTSAPLALAARGFDIDPLDPTAQPAVPITWHTDGTWLWSGAVHHHLDRHHIAPEPELLAHIRQHTYQVPQVGEDAVESAITAIIGSVAQQTHVQRQPVGQTESTEHQERSADQELAEQARRAAVRIALLEAQNAAEELRIDPRRYCLGGVLDEAWCVVQEDQHWAVFFAQRGDRHHLVGFDSLDQAIAFLVGNLYLSRNSLRAKDTESDAAGPEPAPDMVFAEQPAPDEPFEPPLLDSRGPAAFVAEPATEDPPVADSPDAEPFTHGVGVFLNAPRDHPDGPEPFADHEPGSYPDDEDDSRHSQRPPSRVNGHHVIDERAEAWEQEPFTGHGASHTTYTKPSEQHFSLPANGFTVPETLFEPYQDNTEESLRTPANPEHYGTTPAAAGHPAYDQDPAEMTTVIHADAAYPPFTEHEPAVERPTTYPAVAEYAGHGEYSADSEHPAAIEYQGRPAPEAADSETVLYAQQAIPGDHEAPPAGPSHLAHGQPSFHQPGFEPPAEQAPTPRDLFEPPPASSHQQFDEQFEQPYGARPAAARQHSEHHLVEQPGFEPDYSSAEPQHEHEPPGFTSQVSASTPFASTPFESTPFESTPFESTPFEQHHEPAGPSAEPAHVDFGPRPHDEPGRAQPGYQRVALAESRHEHHQDDQPAKPASSYDARGYEPPVTPASDLRPHHEPSAPTDVEHTAVEPVRSASESMFRDAQPPVPAVPQQEPPSPPAPSAASRQAAQPLVTVDQPSTPAQPGPRPSAQPATWPFQPLANEPPLSLFQDKEVVVLLAGSEVDRFGSTQGNVAYQGGTPFPQRSLPPEWADLEYHAYRLQQPVQAIRGRAVPWFEQPGGGTGYVLPRSMASLIADGVLVELVTDQE